MGNSLTEIAQQLKDNNKKVQLIYAFNGTGKTRLSREFKLLVMPRIDGDIESEAVNKKILYYNAFTEDLFYWKNASESVLKIHPNSFTKWILQVQGQDQNIITNFQHYTNEKLMPHFNEAYTIEKDDGAIISIDAFTEIHFSYERGNDEYKEKIKISKGEESNLIWCIFYSLIEQVIEVLNVAELSERETEDYNNLEYIFIDDPVSSLDDNHLIELAVDLAKLIKSSESDVKFILTTHNPLFYNVLCNELNGNNKESGYKSNRDFKKYRLEKMVDETFLLENQLNDSPFSYHLYLISQIEKAMQDGQLRKYHFSFLRNILEKTSTFLGYAKWGELVPTDTRDGDNHYERRILNLSNHSKHSGEEIAELTNDDKNMINYLLQEIKNNHKFK